MRTFFENNRIATRIILLLLAFTAGWLWIGLEIHHPVIGLVFLASLIAETWNLRKNNCWKRDERCYLNPKARTPS
jgi:hypothetical protein